METRIGFIGTGTIASAIVTGFCTDNTINHNIYLSPRNEKKATQLANKFTNVKVASSNQEVLDKSEWVVLSIVPELGEEIIKPLSFRADHRVINLMSDIKLPEIANWIGETCTLVHMVPLPFISRRIGPIVVYPKNRDVANLFRPLGEIIEVDQIEKVEALAAITGLMSSYYKLISEVIKWGVKHGLSQNEATNYTISFFEALMSQIKGIDYKELNILAEEMTPGGLNEMALNSIYDNNGFELWTEALDIILSRLRK